MNRLGIELCLGFFTILIWYGEEWVDLGRVKCMIIQGGGVFVFVGVFGLVIDV